MEEIFEKAASFLKGFGEPARLKIIYLLHHRGPLNVGAIQKELDTTQALVSRHLHQLLERGMVKVKQKNQERIYEINYENRALYQLLPIIEVSLLEAY